MKRIYQYWRIIGLVVLLSQNLLAQFPDTTRFSLIAGVQGRTQSGNLNQIALGGNINALLKNERFSVEISSVYNYAKIEDFVPVNDLWSYVTGKLNPNKQVYLLVIGLQGFSESFAITQSWMGGAGAGWNVMKPQPYKLFQVNLYSSYLNFNYRDLPLQQSPAGGLLTRLVLPLLQNRLNIRWEFHGYMATNNADFHGFQNQVELQIPLTRQLSFTVNHSIFYGGIVNPDKVQTNTFTLFGVCFNTQQQ